MFATRSPFRPNPIGLSCVKLQKIQQEKDGPVIYVSGVDILDGTPIYDIKPYLPHSDMKSDATGGFADRFSGYRLDVVIAPDVECDRTGKLHSPEHFLLIRAHRIRTIPTGYTVWILPDTMLNLKWMAACLLL